MIFAHFGYFSCQIFSTGCVKYYLMHPEVFDDRRFICSLWSRQADALDALGDIE